MSRLRDVKAAILAILIGSSSAVTTASAQNANPAPIQGESASTTILELFTSQACSRCTPASEYFSELAARPGVVALAWHVDYWNGLNSGRSGPWKDPYSSAEYTKRQRAYNQNIRHRNTVFTPQAIIGGVETAVGSNRDLVEALISKAPITRHFTPRIRRDGSTLSITVDSDNEPIEAILVTFQRDVVTDVTGGENAGLTLTNTNVVKGVRHLGLIEKISTTFAVAAPDNGEGCALILQEPGQGRIHSAIYCPAEI